MSRVHPIDEGFPLSLRLSAPPPCQGPPRHRAPSWELEVGGLEVIEGGPLPPLPCQICLCFSNLEPQGGLHSLLPILVLILPCAGTRLLGRCNSAPLDAGRILRRAGGGLCVHITPFHRQHTHTHACLSMDAPCTAGCCHISPALLLLGFVPAISSARNTAVCLSHPPAAQLACAFIRETLPLSPAT